MYIVDMMGKMYVVAFLYKWLQSLYLSVAITCLRK